MSLVVIFLLSWVFQSCILYACILLLQNWWNAGRWNNCTAFKFLPQVGSTINRNTEYSSSCFPFFFPSINWDYSEYNLLVLDYLASSINLDKVHIIPWFTFCFYQLCMSAFCMHLLRNFPARPFKFSSLSKGL